MWPLKPEDFSGDVIRGSAVLPEIEKRGPVHLIGYKPWFNQVGNCWSVDVALGSSAYMPFVRLAVVRWQPASLNEQLAVSAVSTLDMIQLLPRRTLTVVCHPDLRRMTVTLRGPTYHPLHLDESPAVWAGLYRQDPDDLRVWAPIEGDNTIELTQRGSAPEWTGTIDYSSTGFAKSLRLRVVEHEGRRSWEGAPTSRVVYVGELDVSTLPTSLTDFL